MIVTLPVWLMVVAPCFMAWLCLTFLIGTAKSGGDYDFNFVPALLHALNTFFWTVAALGGVILCLCLRAP